MDDLTPTEMIEVEAAMPHVDCTVYLHYTQFLNGFQRNSTNDPIGFFGKVLERPIPTRAELIGFQIERIEGRPLVIRDPQDYEIPRGARLEHDPRTGIYLFQEREIPNILVNCSIGPFAIDDFVRKQQGEHLVNLIRELSRELVPYKA